MPEKTYRAPGESLPPLKDMGMSHLAAAGKGGVALQSALVVSGGAPDTVVLADLGLSDMADDQYAVLVDGETAARVTVDESTKTPQGFDILGGGATEVLNVVVVGRLKGQAAS